MKPTTFYLTLLLILLLSACTKPKAGQIEAKDAWVRAAAAPQMQMDSGSSMSGSEHMSGGTSAAYMVLHNLTDETDRLVSVTTDAAESAGMHITQVENDIATMRPVDSIEVPPQGETKLVPGGLHIMLMGLKHELKAGDKVRLILQFEKAGAVSVEAEVRLP
jgi:copper(I)-binding protein